MIGNVIRRRPSNSTTRILALRLCSTYNLRQTGAARPVGIFWDVDNVRPPTPGVKDHVSALRALAQSIGELDAFTAFGNSSTLSRGSSRNPRLSHALRKQGVSCVRTTIVRNAADARLISAARSFIYTRGAGACLVIVSGDGDLLPLALESRERGVAVVTVTLHRPPARRLVDSSDIVFFLRSHAASALSPLGETLLRGHGTYQGAGQEVHGKRRSMFEEVEDSLDQDQAEGSCYTNGDSIAEDAEEDEDEDEDEEDEDEGDEGGEGELDDDRDDDYDQEEEEDEQEERKNE